MSSQRQLMPDHDAAELETALADGSAQWSLYAENVQTGAISSWRADVLVDTMSVIKVPLLVHLLELADAGEVDLTRRVTITAERKRFGTGVLASLTDGVQVTLADAAQLMIMVSDNTATDIVFEAVGGPSQLNEALVRRGLTQTAACGTAFDWFRHLATSMDPACASYSPGELFTKGYPLSDPEELRTARRRYHLGGGASFGVTTAAEFGRLMRLLERGEYTQTRVRERALSMLAQQAFRSRIPRYLPAHVTVHHKTGDFSPFIANDVGLIRTPNAPTLVLCMFSSGNTRPWGYAEEILAKAALACWTRTIDQADSTDGTPSTHRTRRTDNADIAVGAPEQPQPGRD